MSRINKTYTTKNLQDSIAKDGTRVEGAINKAHRFISNIIAPLLAEIQVAYKKPMKITAREIQDEYGKAAMECFKLIFKLKNRGGYSKEKSTGFTSEWIVSNEALTAFLEWKKITKEHTCRDLKNYLILSGLTEQKLHQGTFYAKAMFDQIRDSQRKKDKLVRDALIKRSLEEIEQNSAVYF